MDDLNGWVLWNWDKGPFFGELVLHPEKKDLFIGRENLINETARRLEQQSKMRRINVNIVCGSPGVGKSTFVDQLLRQKFPRHHKRITLFRNVENLYSANNSLSISDYLSIFGQIDLFLTDILAGRQQTPVRSSIEQKWEGTESTRTPENEFETLIELIRDELGRKCRQIHSFRNEIDQYYIAIDDVDHLTSKDQTQLLTIIAGLASGTTNPSFLYTARPLAAGIAKLRVTSMAGAILGPPIKVPALDVNEVLDVRISSASSKRSAINPFKSSEVKDFIERFCCGNIRTALDASSSVQHKAGAYLNARKLIFTRDDVVDALFGDPVEKDQECIFTNDVEEARDVVNIFCKSESSDQVPVFYVALLAVHSSKTKTNGPELFSMFNQICREINPENVGQNNYPSKDIEHILERCHKMHLIRRVSITNTVKYEKYREAKPEGNSVKHTKINLTSKGELLLMMSNSDANYQKLCGLDYWRILVQKRVLNRRFTLGKSIEGPFLIEEESMDEN